VLERDLVRHSKIGRSTSDLGHKRTCRPQIPMSALPPKADIPQRDLNVCFGPNSDIGRSAANPLYPRLADE
jgi:hypothetical protein